MSEILANVNKKHASDQVKYYALYNYYFMGFSKTKISKIYNKSITTITNWISRYEETGEALRHFQLLSLQQRSVDLGSVAGPDRNRIPSKFDEEKYQWLLDLYRVNPTLYLDEARHKFQKHFNESISASYICQILHKNNMSWKTLEKRAIQIRDSEIVKFCEELSAIDWDYSNIVFLDEVAIDNQGLLRTKGYGIVGKKLFLSWGIQASTKDFNVGFSWAKWNIGIIQNGWYVHQSQIF